MTTSNTTVTPVETTKPQVGDKLSDRLTSRRTTRRIKQKHRQAALKEKIAHQGEVARILRTGNAIALKLESTRKLIIRVLLPALFAFGAWSTAGVQAGAVAVTGATEGSAMWWALWALEPALIAIVAVVVIVQCRLGAQDRETGAGADPLAMAAKVMWGALLVSLVLNTVGHWPSDWEGAGGLLFHALGPIGAAATVHLIGVLLEAVDAVPVPPEEEPQESAEESQEQAPESGLPGFSVVRERLSERALEIPAGATRLPIVQCGRPIAPTAVQKAPRSTGEQEERPAQKSVDTGSRKARPDKGTKVPAAAKKTSEPVSPRRVSDMDLSELLSERIDHRELDPAPTVKAVQESLGIGFERAKRVLAIQQERTEAVLPGQLNVVDEAETVAA